MVLEKLPKHPPPKDGWNQSDMIMCVDTAEWGQCITVLEVLDWGDQRGCCHQNGLFLLKNSRFNEIEIRLKENEYMFECNYCKACFICNDEKKEYSDDEILEPLNPIKESNIKSFFFYFDYNHSYIDKKGFDKKEKEKGNKNSNIDKLFAVKEIKKKAASGKMIPKKLESSTSKTSKSKINKAKKEEPKINKTNKSESNIHINFF